MKDNDKFKISLELTKDGPNRINFSDTYEGLDDAWYQFEVLPEGGVNLWANEQGFEHLARYFLKMARSEKAIGFHNHHPLDFHSSAEEERELTIGLCEAPDGPQAT